MRTSYVYPLFDRAVRSNDPRTILLARRSDLVVIPRQCASCCFVCARVRRVLCGGAQVGVASLKNRRKTAGSSSKVAKHASLFRFIVVGNRDGSPDRPFAGCRGCHVRPGVSEDAVE
jgi:hypothetical protein